jgi:uncharacterized protein YjbJ (UPF0337 family)
MIWGHIQANWKRFQPQIRHRWDKLTDEDVARIKGHRGVLIDCLQRATGTVARRPSRKSDAGSTNSNPNR